MVPILHLNWRFKKKYWTPITWKINRGRINSLELLEDEKNEICNSPKLPTNDFIVGVIMKLYCQDLNDLKISMLNNENSLKLSLLYSRKSETANLSCLTDLCQNSRIKIIIIVWWFIIKSWTITRKWSSRRNEIVKFLMENNSNINGTNKEIIFLEKNEESRKLYFSTI